MNNIFENAKFGDKFKTRDGRMAIYNGRSIDRYWLIVERRQWRLFGFNSCGRHSGLEEDIDIISEWQEEVNEEELDKLAKEYMTEERICIIKSACDLSFYDLETAFKAGYRQALQQ